MVGIKKMLVLLLMVGLVITISGCKKKDDRIQIGISQFVTHPALDSVQQGFIDGLSENGFKEGENIHLVTENAQGDVSNANLIADHFLSKKMDLVLAIATPSAQSLKNVFENSKTPVLFSAVTDPVSAGLTGTNITGTSDMTPIEKQLTLLETIMPDIKKVGIIYNTSEVNSEVQVNIAKEVAKKLGLTLVIKGVTSTTEISLALDSLVSQVDALYVPADNLVVSSISLVVSKANDAHIPVVGSEKSQVEQGALITEGIDYYQLGVQTGKMASDILNGKKVSDIPFETISNTELVINMDAARILGLSIPQNLQDIATLIGGGN